MFNIFRKKISDRKSVVEEGDMILGIDTLTNKLIKIPLSDRYFHTLITGSSETKNVELTLLPSIKRDIEFSLLDVTFMDCEPYIAEEIYNFAKEHNQKALYLNPSDKNSPYINILKGKEDSLIEIWVDVFKMMNPEYYNNPFSLEESLIRKSLKIIKRTYGDNATLLDLDKLLNNKNGEALNILHDFADATRRKSQDYEINEEIFHWYINEYLNSKNCEKGGIFNDTKRVREFVNSLTENKHLRNVLLPDASKEELDFTIVFEYATTVCINTDYNLLKDMSSCLGYFLINLYQCYIHDRALVDSPSIGDMLYLRPLEKFINTEFLHMLSSGRYRGVAVHGITEKRSDLHFNCSRINMERYLEMIDKYFANKIIYNGDSEDSIFYSKHCKKIINTSEFILPKNFDISILDPDAINNRAFGEFTYCVINDVHHALPSVAHAHPSYINKDVLNKKED